MSIIENNTYIHTIRNISSIHEKETERRCPVSAPVTMFLIHTQMCMICFSHDKIIPQIEQNNLWSHSLFLLAYSHELESMEFDRTRKPHQTLIVVIIAQNYKSSHVTYLFSIYSLSP